MARSPHDLLSDPRLRVDLVHVVRSRVPASEVDDIVQAALAEALASPSAPTELAALRRWIFVVARSKVVDFYRRARRERPADLPDVPDDQATDADEALLRWAESELPDSTDAPRTLEWMLREGGGEELEAIAESEKLPPPRVRQRVSRLRRHLRARWAARAAVLLALGVVVAVALHVLRRRKLVQEVIAPEIHSAPLTPRLRDSRLELAHQERDAALRSCDEGRASGGAAAWRECLRRLDRARDLDPAGDADPRVTAARKEAARALAVPTPAPSATPRVVQTSTAPPAPTPAPTPVPTFASHGSHGSGP